MGKGLEENKKFKFIGKGLYFYKEEILVLADLHIGYEEYLNENGIFVPRVQFKEIMEELKGIFRGIKKKKIKRVVILGDLKHEFGKISKQEWIEVEDVLDFLKKRAEKIILIKGNHDNILKPIVKRKELRIRDFYVRVGVCFLHGHKLFPKCLDKKIKMLVIGHRHPAVVLADEYKKERYKCFLVGKWKDKEIIILPSFFPFIEGGNIIGNYEENKLFIPEKKLKEFDVFILGKKQVYRFGKLKGII